MDLPHRYKNQLPNEKEKTNSINEMPLVLVWWTHLSHTFTQPVHQHCVLSSCTINSGVTSNLLVIVYCWVSCVEMNIHANDFMFFQMATHLFWSTDWGAQWKKMERKLGKRSGLFSSVPFTIHYLCAFLVVINYHRLVIFIDFLVWYSTECQSL